MTVGREESRYKKAVAPGQQAMNYNYTTVHNYQANYNYTTVQSTTTKLLLSVHNYQAIANSPQLPSKL